MKPKGAPTRRRGTEGTAGAEGGGGGRGGARGGSYSFAKKNSCVRKVRNSVGLSSVAAFIMVTLPASSRRLVKPGKR